MSAAALLVGLSYAAGGRADDAIDAWARWAMTPKVWKGQVVPAPLPSPRPLPDGARVLESLELPVRLLVPPRTGAAGATLASVERAYRRFRDAGWPLPAERIDVYALPGLPASEARVDRLEAPSDFDAADTYALAPLGLAPAQRRACVQSALAQAALRALEPAEADTWVRAAGEYVAWRETGEPGCLDSFALAQQAPARSMLGRDEVAFGSGGLFFAYLSERHGDEFIRALWELARQRSKGLVPDDQLRGAPDVFEVLSRVLESANETWQEAVVEFSAARWFAGDARRRNGAAYRVFSGLPSDAAVPLLAEFTSAQLPRRARTDAEGGIEALGSAYVRLSLADDAVCVAQGCALRVWLRGELGPHWALTALRLDAEGRELGRTHAPARDVPHSYLPLTLEPGTGEVILVITHLPRELPDADHRAPALHGVELTIDRDSI